jgi:hypothetical protein
MLTGSRGLSGARTTDHGPDRTKHQAQAKPMSGPPPSSPQGKPRSVSSQKLLGGLCIISANTAIAPLERLQLLMQSQGQLVATGRLEAPYKVRLALARPPPLPCFICPHLTSDNVVHGMALDFHVGWGAGRGVGTGKWPACWFRSPLAAPLVA